MGSSQSSNKLKTGSTPANRIKNGFRSRSRTKADAPSADPAGVLSESSPANKALTDIVSRFPPPLDPPPKSKAYRPNKTPLCPSTELSAPTPTPLDIPTLSPPLPIETAGTAEAYIASTPALSCFPSSDQDLPVQASPTLPPGHSHPSSPTLAPSAISTLIIPAISPSPSPDHAPFIKEPTTLTPELWLHVLDFLSPPLPKPLSGLTKSEGVGESEGVIANLPEDGAPGMVSRKDIRAPALALLTRTSIVFNKLAAKILYRRVVCDDLASLIVGHANPPAHPDLPSKKSLLLGIRFLHLEYRQKYPKDPTYQGLMEDGRYMEILGYRHMHPRHTAIMHAQIEAWDLKKSLDEMREMLEQTALAAYSAVSELLEIQPLNSDKGPFGRLLPSFIKHVFDAAAPRITHVTVGMIFGGQDGLWSVIGPRSEAMTFGDDWHPLQILIAQCRLAVENTFSTMRLTHFCQRGTVGPLSLPPVCPWIGQTTRPDPTFPLFTIHFGTRTRPLPVAFCHRTRWIYELLGQHSTTSEVNMTVLRGIKDIRSRRKVQSDQAPSTGAVELDIWASGDRLPSKKPMSADAQRKAAAGLAESLSRSAGKYDKFSVQASVDSPCCEACGAGYVGGV